MRGHDEKEGRRKLECGLCGYKFKRRDHMNAHIKLHTGESAATCQQCGKTLSSALALKIHIANVHQARVRSHQCSKCDFKAMYPATLKIHMAVHSRARPFKCNFCDYAAKWEYTLVKHMQLHTGEKHYVCNLCPFSSVQKGPLSRHHKIVHQGDESKPFRCRTCPRTFASKNNLKCHEATHKEDRPFKCDQCPYAAKVAGWLITHKLQVHSGRKEHKCLFCDSAFARSCSLLVHLKIHTGEKPFTCGQCSYATFRRSDLKKHEQIHLEAKSFKCEHCSYTGPRLDLLKGHQGRKHSNEKSQTRSLAHAETTEASVTAKRPPNRFREDSFHYNRAEADPDLIQAKSYKCRHCELCCNNNAWLALHLTVEHSWPKVVLQRLP